MYMVCSYRITLLELEYQFLKFIILVLFLFVKLALSTPILNSHLPNHVLKHGESFQFVIPEGSFTSTDNSTLYYAVNSPNDWIKREFGSKVVRSGFFFFRPYSIKLEESEEGDYLFCADEYFGLRILDITDFDYVLVSELSLSGGARSIFLDSGFVFIATKDRFRPFIYIIDVNDKHNPEVITEIECFGYHEKVIVKDEYLFAIGESGVRIMDISDKAEPTSVSYFPSSHITHDIELIEDMEIAIISDGDGGIRAINISTITSPFEIGSFDTYHADRLSIVNKYNGEEEKTYVVYNSNEYIRILDISNLTCMKHIWRSEDVYAYSKPIATYESSVFYVRSGGMSVISNFTLPITNSLNFEFDESLENKDMVFRSKANQTVILACRGFGLLVLNVSDETSPISYEIGTKSQMVDGVYVDETKDVAYLVGGNYFHILDVSDKSSPSVLLSSSFLSSSLYRSVTQGPSHYPSHDQYIFVAGRGLTVFDVGDTSNPVISTTYLSEYPYKNRVVIEGHIAYLGKSQDIVEILDISDMGNIFRESIFDCVCYIEDVFVLYDDETEETTLYISGRDQGLYIVDVSDSKNPFLLSKFSTVKEVYGIHVFRFLQSDQPQQYLTYAYLAVDEYFQVVNVTNRSEPVEVSRTKDPEFVNLRHISVDESNMLAYLTDLKQTDEVFVFDISYNPPIRDAWIQNLKGTANWVTSSLDGGGYIYVATSAGLEIFGGKDLILFEDVDDTFSCGNISVTVEAMDGSTSTATDTFYIFKEYNTSDPTGLCKAMGSCINYVECECFTGEWDGQTCEYPVCFNISSEGSGTYFVCTGHGNCNDPDECECTSPEVWNGPECQFHHCFGVLSNNLSHVCGGHGNCVEMDKCLCQFGYSSNEDNAFGDCTLWYCKEILYSDEAEVCSGRGRCMDHNLCVCSGNYEGDDCESWNCGGIDKNEFTSICSGRGNCISPGKCRCRSGYFGKNCKDNLLYYTVMTPLLSLFGLGLGVCVLITCYVAYVCCCVCISALVLCMFGLSGIVAKQMKGLRKFSKLKNFDLYLREQELEDDTSVAHLKIDKALFEVEFKEIELISILGEGGSSSVVYRAKWRDMICENQDSFDEFEREVSILGSIRHPNVLQFYGCSLKPPRIGILMEFCENGDVSYYIKLNPRSLKNEKSGLNFSEKLRIASEIVKPMAFLHSRSIIHRDLKLENVLLDKNITCKLMDFGLSKIVDQMSKVKTRNIGTSYYMAPEVLEGDYNEKIDVFAFGMCAYILFTEDFHPYGLDVMSIEMKVAMDPTLRPKVKNLMKYFSEENDAEEELPSSSCVKWLSDIIGRCWDHSPERRPGFSNIEEELKEKMGEFISKGQSINHHDDHEMNENQNYTMSMNNNKIISKNPDDLYISPNEEEGKKDQKLFQRIKLLEKENMKFREEIQFLKRKLEENCDD